jgi:DNA-binding response OmpR family regulator
MSTERIAVLLEDNLMFAMSLEPALRQLGYQVRTLGGGADPVDRVVAAQPGLVLVNLTSTRFPGANTVRELRSRSEMAGVGIIGYAGHVERHFFQEGREAGADLVVPNSAIRKALPEVISKLERLRAGEAPSDDDWPE